MVLVVGLKLGRLLTPKEVVSRLRSISDVGTEDDSAKNIICRIRKVARDSR